jgi:hypothetical protein
MEFIPRIRRLKGRVTWPCAPSSRTWASSLLGRAYDIVVRDDSGFITPANVYQPPGALGAAAGKSDHEPGRPRVGLHRLFLPADRQLSEVLYYQSRAAW